MDSKSQEVLQEILSTDPELLNPDQVAFLRARRSYLTKEHKRIYASVLGNEPVEEKKTTRTTPANPGEHVAPEGSGQDEDVRVDETTQENNTAETLDTVNQTQEAAGQDAEEGEDLSQYDPDAQPSQ